MKTPEPSAAEGRAVRMLRALANPVRFRIVVLLAERKDATSPGLVAELGPRAIQPVRPPGGVARGRDRPGWPAGSIRSVGPGQRRWTAGPARTIASIPGRCDFLSAFLSGLGQRARSWEGLVVTARQGGRHGDPGGDARGRGGDRPHLQPGDRGPGRDPGDRPALPGGARRAGWRARARATRSWSRPGAMAERQGRSWAGPRSTSSTRGPPTITSSISRSTSAREHRGRGIGDALLGALKAGPRARLPQDGPGGLPLQRPRDAPLRAPRLPHGRHLPRAGDARWPLGRRDRDGEDAGVDGSQVPSCE